jgi:hypothetical protein
LVDYGEIKQDGRGLKMQGQQKDENQGQDCAIGLKF